ncbi:MAG: L-serine ammonia-lyase, iron-sulfur-dependent, subunit alpha, partial [Chloroflexota bacterium]|nr:L-serine ammonia-lyase, iron-sulfur-dependent, subunit alpha [Chloroflexota bacterium]
MTISVFDLFKIGIGPSSSHTVGPMRAARQFALRLRDEGRLAHTHHLIIELFGSLGATGKGHGSDKAILLGLQGEEPDKVDVEAIEAQLATIRAEKRINVLGEHAVEFLEKEHLLFRRNALPYHPNGMRFAAVAADGQEIISKVYYSVGGGFVVDESATGADRIKQDETPLPYSFDSGDQLLALCRTHNLSISQVMLENEKSWRSEAEIRGGLLKIWDVMQACVRRGCQNEGILPGGMKVRRRA